MADHSKHLLYKHLSWASQTKAGKSPVAINHHYSVVSAGFTNIWPCRGKGLTGGTCQYHTRDTGTLPAYNMHASHLPTMPGFLCSLPRRWLKEIKTRHCLFYPQTHSLWGPWHPHSIVSVQNPWQLVLLELLVLYRFSTSKLSFLTEII